MLLTFVRRVAVVAVPLMMLAVAPGTSVATAPSASIQFNHQAQLQPDASVLLTLTYSCNPDAFSPLGQVAATVTQPSSDPTEFGAFGNAIDYTGVCDGKKHKLTLDVVSFFSPFTAGTASAVASVTGEASVSTASTGTVLLHVK